MNIDLVYQKNGLGGPLNNKFLADLREISGSESFIETGTYFGDTVESVRTEFKNVLSIELSEELANKAKARFSGIKNVEILNGDSGIMLAQALDRVKGKASVIWLDAHYSGVGTSKAFENTPVIDEIIAIDRFGSGSDVILIDDIRMFRPVASGFLTHEAVGGYPDLKSIVSRIEKIGKGYKSILIADILLSLPLDIFEKVIVSSVVDATTKLRLGGLSKVELEQLERVIMTCDGDEQATIFSLPDIFAQQLAYGLGGEFCYWRALKYLSMGKVSEANLDFAVWDKCKVVC